MIKSISIIWHYFLSKRRLRFTPEQLHRWQERRRKKIQLFAKKHSPFYKEHPNEYISKKTMMEHFTRFNTRGIDREKAFELALRAEQTRDFSPELNGLAVGLSSGTSGNRGLFLVSRKERNMWCGNILARTLPLPPWKKQKIAFFLRANNPLYETIRSRRLSFRFFDLLDPPSSLRQKLEEFNPDVLIAPPSMLLLLVGSCHPKRVISVAETLFSTDKERLERAFNQPIHQVYQCTEGFLAFTCEHGTLHINEDLIYMEKEPIEEGVFSPIITDLFRTTQPIIRYKLNDVLVEKKDPCPCGCHFQALERIEGRCDDVLIVNTIEGVEKPLFPDFICRKIITACLEIEDFTVTQKKHDQWEIYLNPFLPQQVSVSLNALFKQIGAIPPKLIFVETKAPPSPGVKLRRIFRDIPK